MRVAVVIVSFLLIGGVLSKRRHQKDEENETEVDENDPRLRKDPCLKKKCGLGYECYINEETGRGACECRKECPEELDPRAKVCSTTNVTLASECELHRQRCMCRKNTAECEKKEYRYLRLDYFGPCKQLSTCSEEHMEEFPRRMREWLFLVMSEMATRKDLNRQEMRMAKQAKKQKVRHWVLPVIWKFCDLDTSNNRHVNFREMEPIRAPLKPLEHCMAPFLDKCDEDNNQDITLQEWGKCLGVDDSELLDRCNGLRG